MPKKGSPSRATKPTNPPLRMSEVPPLDLDALTFEERRVAIARDVLALLDARRLRPTRGVYIWPIDFSHDVHDLSPDELRKLLDAPPRTCEVCAMGASLVSFVRVFDRVAGEDFDERSIERVREAMGVDYSWMVEAAFEQSYSRRDPDGRIWELRDYNKWPNARRRLRELMKGIVETGGDYAAFRDRFWVPESL